MNINIVTEVVWLKIRNQVFDETRHRVWSIVNDKVQIYILDHGLSQIKVGVRYAMRRIKYAKSDI